MAKRNKLEEKKEISVSPKILPHGKNQTLDLNKIPVSTKTFIIMTNLNLNIPKLWEVLPITEYEIVSRKRGRKKKIDEPDPNQDLPSGSIITLELGNKHRGVLLKKKKKKEGKISRPFRNSMTVVMLVDGKMINFKLTRNGKFQMTGCKTDNQAVDCVKYIWTYINDPEIIGEFQPSDLYTFENSENENFEAIFIPAMRNIDFNLGFMVNREKLDEYFNTKTDYISLLETSIGYTGVNIKIPINIPITSIKIKKLVFNQNTGWQKIKVSFQEYLDRLTPKEREKKLKKERFVTFLVFNSGSTIVSAMCKNVIKDVFYEFCRIVQENRELFEEKLT